MRHVLSLCIYGLLLLSSQASATGLQARRDYIARNYGPALTIAQSAAEEGDSIAMLMLGRLYFEGKGVQQDYAAALKWWRASADLGNSKAQNNIGVLFQNGLGVPKDYKEAARWFELSASHNEAVAYYNLSGLYQKGRGIETNYGKALELLMRAEALYKEELLSDPENSGMIKKGLGRAIQEIALLTDYLEKLKVDQAFKKALKDKRQEVTPR